MKKLIFTCSLKKETISQKTFKFSPKLVHEFLLHSSDGDKNKKLH